MSKTATCNLAAAGKRWLRPACLAFTGFLSLGRSGVSQEFLLPEQLRQMQSQWQAFALVDVRSPEDFGHRHIDGAINIPKNRLDRAVVPKGRPLVLYCGDARCPLGHEAAKVLKSPLTFMLIGILPAETQIATTVLGGVP